MYWSVFYNKWQRSLTPLIDIFYLFGRKWSRMWLLLILPHLQVTSLFTQLCRDNRDSHSESLTLFLVACRQGHTCCHNLSNWFYTNKQTWEPNNVPKNPNDSLMMVIYFFFISAFTVLLCHPVFFFFLILEICCTLDANTVLLVPVANYLKWEEKKSQIQTD